MAAELPENYALTRLLEVWGCLEKYRGLAEAAGRGREAGEGKRADDGDIQAKMTRGNSAEAIARFPRQNVPCPCRLLSARRPQYSRPSGRLLLLPRSVVALSALASAPRSSTPAMLVLSRLRKHATSSFKCHLSSDTPHQYCSGFNLDLTTELAYYIQRTLDLICAS